MTPRRLAPPAARRALSLRVTLLAVALVAGLYAGALPVYLYFRISRPALALGAVTEAVADAAEILAHRDGALDHAVALVRRLVRGATLRADSVNAAQRLLEIGETPLPIQPDAPIPPDLRAALTRTDACFGHRSSVRSSKSISFRGKKFFAQTRRERRAYPSAICKE